MMAEQLPWQRPFRRRCRAVREPRPGVAFHGRCELAAGHDGDHALERGFDTPRWSTDWSDGPGRLDGTRPSA